MSNDTEAARVARAAWKSEAWARRAEDAAASASAREALAETLAAVDRMIRDVARVSEALAEAEAAAKGVQREQ